MVRWGQRDDKFLGGTKGSGSCFCRCGSLSSFRADSNVLALRQIDTVVEHTKGEEASRALVNVVKDGLAPALQR